MKLNGFVGKGTGKLGSSVFAVSGGEQIVRQYNPNVSNPSTDAQVAQRAKFKLLSQIAADLATVIAIPKQGLVSSRNLFVKRNFALAEYEGGQAKLDAFGLQLTPSNSFIPDPVVSSGANQLEIELNEGVGDSLDGVVYVVVKSDAIEQMEVVKVLTITEPGQTNTFPTIVTNVSGNGVVYAYGIKKGALSEIAKYDNYNVAAGFDVAQLITLRSIKNASAALTGTSSIEWSVD